jgi:Zinc carboxypeptidase
MHETEFARVVRRLFFALSVAASGCGPIDTGLVNPENYSQVHSDSGIDFPDYAGIVAGLDKAAAASNGRAAVVRYGKSAEGKELVLLRIADPRVQVSERPAVWISETTHGNEYLHVTDQLATAFAAEQSGDKGLSRFLAVGGIVYLVPVFNPDGFSSRQRENSRGKDLNRDYDLKVAGKTGFTQPETRTAFEYLDKDLTANRAKLKLSYDYHCCVGAILYPWGYEFNKAMPDADLKEHLRVADRVKRIQRYVAGTPPEIVKYTAVGASDDFYHERYGALAFTLEGVENSEYRRMNEHLQFFDETFADLAGSVPATPPVVGGSDAFLRIVREDQPGQLLVAVAGVQTAVAAELCYGTLQQCQSTVSSRVPLVFQSDAGGRRFFAASSAITVTDKAIVTVFVKDAAGAVLAARAVRFVAKGGGVSH